MKNSLNESKEMLNKILNGFICIKVSSTNVMDLLMDPNKWKSVAVSIEVYEMLKQLADKNERSVSRQLAHLVKQVAQKEAA